MSDSISEGLLSIQNANPSCQTPADSERNKNIISNKRNPKKKLKKMQNKNPQLNKIKGMLNKAQIVIENSEINFLPFLSNNAFGTIRRKYCNQILKCLLIGYQQLREQVERKRIDDEEWLITRETLIFFQKYSDIEISVLALVQIAGDIQSEMFQLHGIRFGQQDKQPRKYKFQMVHFLRNLKDIYNCRFRQEIITGILPPKSVASMDELQMLQPNKRQFIITKNKNLLYSRDQTRRHKKVLEKKQDEFKSSQIIVNCRRQQEAAINEANSQEQKLSYFFCKSFIDKLEIQIMQIPDKAMRKRILLNLKKELKE